MILAVVSLHQLLLSLHKMLIRATLALSKFGRNHAVIFVPAIQFLVHLFLIDGVEGESEQLWLVLMIGGLMVDYQFLLASILDQAIKGTFFGLTVQIAIKSTLLQLLTLVVVVVLWITPVVELGLGGETLERISILILFRLNACPCTQLKRQLMVLVPIERFAAHRQVI